MKYFLLLLLLSVSISASVSEAQVSSSRIGLIDLREERKIGIGTQILGSSGSAGLLLEMNFHPIWSLNLGYGVASDFTSFLVEYKRLLYGERLTTYGLLGFSRWYGESEGEIQSTNPGFVADKFMSASDRANGIINENLIYPGLGLQYINDRGDWAGLSVFAQLVVLIDIEDLIVVPTFGLGSIYYF